MTTNLILLSLGTKGVRIRSVRTPY